jgi:aminopeptidase-like protein
VNIYPNPSNGQFTIDAGNWTNAALTATITNQLGDIVYFTTIKSTKTNIDLSHFANGVYVIKLTDGENEIIEKLSKY